MPEARPTRAAPHLNRILGVLAPLLEADRSPAMVERLAVCLQSLPDGAAVPYLGLCLDRAEPIVRVCVTGLGGAWRAYLDAVGWPGDGAELDAEVLTPIGRALAEPPRDPSILHLDLTPDVAPRIGFEYAFARAPQRHGALREAPVLDHLVTRGWCGAAARDALLAWPARSVELLDHEIWQSRVARRVSHIKVTYATGRPIAIKAYVYVVAELRRGGSLVGWPPRFLGEARATDEMLTPSGARLLVDRPAPRSSRPAGPALTYGAPAGRAIVGGRSFAPRVVYGGGFMDMSPNQQRALDAVLKRSTVDLEFRRQLIVSPHRAIQEAYGVSIPITFRVKFIERDPSIDALIVLPDLEALGGEQASEEDLDCVAGGDGTPPDPGWSYHIGDGTE